MIVLDTILVATDFSETARAGVAQARAYARAFNASLHVLHVVTAPIHEVWVCYAPGIEVLAWLARLQEEARLRLQADLASGGLGGERLTVATAAGDPADEILKYANLHEVDLIVCGTRGRRGIGHLLMGSVAERIVRLADCPVLTVGGAGLVPVRSTGERRGHAYTEEHA